jgi:ABC-type transport system involved in multi-copper enzyme maturation permease subunit
MFWIIVQKELKSIIQSPKFIASFLTFSILILLSFYTGIKEYKDFEKNYNTAVNLIETNIAQADNWNKVSYSAFREPNPMQIFATGINNDIGRFSPVSRWTPIKLAHSVYNDDPIFAVFRYIDFTFIVTIVMSLFAVLFTYDSINGERESGTLKLVFSNSVPRNKYILAKFTGSWLGLVVPITIPVLLGFLIMIISGIPLTGGDWMKIIILLISSLLYFTFFIVLGILVSALTKHSSTSFLVLLVLWIGFVFIIPRVGVMAAGQFINVPTNAELESQRTAYQQQGWKKYSDDMQKVWKERSEVMKGMSEAEKEKYQKDKESEWMEESDKVMKQREKEENDFFERITEAANNKRGQLERLALSLSRISPASAYQLAVMNLGGTDLAMNQRYQTAMKAFREKYNSFVEKKQKEAGGFAGFRISFSSKGGFSFSDGRGKNIDVKDMPKFSYPKETIAASAASSIVDMAIIIILTLGAFAAAYISFLRYDVR